MLYMYTHVVLCIAYILTVYIHALCTYYTTYTLSNYTYTIMLCYTAPVYCSLPHPTDPGPRGHILPHSRYSIYARV